MARARKLVGKDKVVQNVWSNVAKDRLAFSVGGLTWIYMHSVYQLAGELQELLQPAPKTTGLPEGTYCNIAHLDAVFVRDLSEWKPDSEGRKYCNDVKNNLRVEVNSAGFVVNGSAPPGALNGMVVIHKNFPVNSVSSMVAV